MLPLGHIKIETGNMNAAQDSKLSPRKYNKCIIFIPREVTVEEGKIP
jgi:hypothetical protein